MNNTKQYYSIIAGCISLGLLISLIYKLTDVPGGMILSGLFLGVLIIVLILIGGLILTEFSKFILKRIPFAAVFFSITVIAFSVFHYQLYSPSLIIVVPAHYSGQINLVKSNVTKNILTVDSNGIGYLNEWTFDKLYTKPVVEDENGKDITEQCKGFNPSTFFGSSVSTSSKNNHEIRSLNFEILANNKLKENHHVNNDLTELVDLNKIEN